MGMGLMDLLAASQGRGGGMGMMGMLGQSPGMAISPLGSTVVKALLHKHGAAAPATAPGGGTAPAATPPAPDAPVSLSMENTAPKTDLGFDAKPKTLTDALPTMPGGDVKKPNGFFDRIGDFLHSDEGRAALLRSGAATLQGGLGAGIQAGTSFVDQRRAAAAAAAQQAVENALHGKQVDNNYNLGLGRNTIEAAQTVETGRHNQATEGTERSRVAEDFRKHVTPSGDTRLRVAEDRFQHTTPSGDTVATQGGENYRHDTASADNTQDNQTQIMRDRLAHAPTISTHAHYTTTPEEYAKNGPRLKPSQVQPDAAGGATKISSDAEFNDLPSGARFMGPDGQIRIKP